MIYFFILFLSIGASETFDGKPAMGRIFPQNIVKGMEALSSDSNHKGNCAQPDTTKQEEVADQKGKLYHDRKKMLYSINPKIRDVQILKEKYPELTALFKDYRDEVDRAQMPWTAYRKCIDDNKAKLKYEASYEVFAEPSLKSKNLGKLTFIYDSSGLTIFYVNIKGERFGMRPDFMDEDTGYALHTVLGQKDNWLKLPKNPFPHPVWIHQFDVEEAEAKLIDRFDVLTINTKTYSGNVVLEKIEGDYYIGRTADEDFDGPCLNDAKEPKSEKLKIPLKEFFDEDQHVKAKVTYTRGC